MKSVVAIRSPARGGMSLLEAMVLIGTLALLLTLMLPALHGARRAARRTQCSHGVRQILLGIRGSEMSHGYPPAGGASYQDWGLAILPYVDEQTLLDQFDRAWPPGHVSNARAAARVPALLLCPELAVRPSNLPWILPSHYGANGSLAGRRRIRQAARTLLVGELAMQPVFPWITSPTAWADELGANHNGRVMGFADGHVVFRPADAKQDSVRATQ